MPIGETHPEPARLGPSACDLAIGHLTPDPGTAHDDGYYSGWGMVSFGAVPVDNGSLENLKVGAHVHVTVVSALDAGSAVLLVTAA